MSLTQSSTKEGTEPQPQTVEFLGKLPSGPPFQDYAALSRLLGQIFSYDLSVKEIVERAPEIGKFLTLLLETPEVLASPACRSLMRCIVHLTFGAIYHPDDPLEQKSIHLSHYYPLK
jgi:hypothetical protein